MPTSALAGSMDLRDLDKIRQALADAYFPNVIAAPRGGTSVRLRLGTVNLGPCRIMHVALDNNLTVETEHPGAYGINIPLVGHMETVLAGRTEVVGAGRAVACPPDVRAVVTDAAAVSLGFRVDKDYLNSEMERVLDRPGLQLPVRFDLSSGLGHDWLTLVRSVYEQVRTNAGLLRNDAMLARLAATLTTGLVLAAFPDDHSDGQLRPRIVKRVLDAINDDPAREWTSVTMASLAGVSVRRLQQAFREYVGVTPFAYLLDVRLDRAHEDLLAAGSPTTVLEVGLRWGFSHPGRFAAEYRRKFGVPPSHTLLR